MTTRTTSAWPTIPMLVCAGCLWIPADDHELTFGEVDEGQEREDDESRETGERPDTAGDTAEADADHDGYSADLDCDDSDATVHPGAAETCATPHDDDCDGEANEGDATACTDYFPDIDGDGYGADSGGVCACSLPEGYADNADDCDDADPDLTLLASWYRDADGDGFGDPAVTLTYCGQPAGYLADATDCDDADAATSPDGDEVWASGTDEDCDGTVDEEDAILGAWVGTVDLEWENGGYCFGSYTCTGSATATVTADGAGGYELTGTYGCGAAVPSTGPWGGCEGTWTPSGTFEMTWSGAATYFDGAIDVGSCAATYASSTDTVHAFVASVRASGIGSSTFGGRGCPGGDVADVAGWWTLTR